MRYTLVTPFFNESGNIAPLLSKTFAVLDSMNGDWNAVLVNDGSTDDTADELARAVAGRNQCAVVSLPTNLGQAAALLAGLERASGDIILTMDGDGQNDPADFPRVVAPVAADACDMVCGVRTPRNDPVLRRGMSVVANFVRRRVLDDGVSDAGCQLRAFRREIVPVLQPSPLVQAFIPAMAVAAGFRVEEIEVRHHPRPRGRSKYGLARLWWRPAMEMLRLRSALRARRQ